MQERKKPKEGVPATRDADYIAKMKRALEERKHKKHRVSKKKKV